MRLTARAIIAVLAAVFSATAVAAADGVTATDAARASLERALRAAFPDATRMELNAVGRQVSRGSAGTQWVVATPGVDPVPRRVTMAVKLMQGSKEVKTFPVAFNVAVYRPVLCAAHALRPGTEVVPDDFVRCERDVAGVKVPVDPSTAVSGMRVRHYLPEAAVVTAADLVPAPAVIKGREVAVLVAAPSVQIEGRGIAEEDGERGRTIRVRGKNSDATYLAVVVDQGRVRVPGR